MSSSRPHLLLFVAIFLFCRTAFSQHLDIGVVGSYMMTNNSSFSEYNAFAYGLETTWLRQSDGADSSLSLWGYPSFGVKTSFLYIPDGVAGHRFGIAGIIAGPIGRNFEYRLGLGLSAYTRPFELSHNSENIFIGSLLNCLIDLSLNYRLSNALSLSASLLHSSNGSLKIPNQGLNYLQIGANYSLQLPQRHTDTCSLNHHFDHPLGHEYGFTLSPGIVMNKYGVVQGYYFCYDLSLNYLYRRSPIFAYGATADIWFKWSDWTIFKYEKTNYPIPAYLSVMGVVEGYWGPISLRAGIGPHLIVSNINKIPFYERVGLYYNFGNNYVGVALNAHAGKIEFIEWSYGLRLHR